jgi:carboxylate-amine ligase
MTPAQTGSTSAHPHPPEPLRTFGVEEEFLLVDPETATVRPAAPEVVPAGPEPIQHELTREQVETGTPPCVRTSELHDSLVRLRRDAARAAEVAGVALAALGTSPLPAQPTTTRTRRYLQMERAFARLGHEQLTCGCHVHVSVRSRAEAVGALDRIRPWLACLLAVSTNSPFWQGEDTGYASWRTQVWQRWPSAGPTEVFGSEASYDQLADALVSGGLIDRGMLYFDARLSAHLPTLEVRVADVCPSVPDAVLLAALTRALVGTAAAEWAAGEQPVPARTELLRLAHWQASRTGLTGDLVDVARQRPVPARTLLDRLIDHVGAELDRTGDTALVTGGLDRIFRDGTGAERQRAAFARRHDLRDVVRDAVRRTLHDGR